MTTSTAPKPQPYKPYPHADADRPAYAEGLRHLADLIETGAAPFPYGPMSLFLAFGSIPAAEQPAAARDLIRALGGGTYSKDASDATMSLDGMCGGVPIRIYVLRDAVCERVVVGTETVEVPAQPAIEAHTETREIVEWHCGSLLDAADAGASA